MKKIILVIAAIAVFTACSKQDVIFEEPDQIGISPVAQNITKSMLSGTQFPNEQFNVWAYYKQIDKGTTITEWQTSTLAQQEYIKEKPFTQTSETSKLWGGVVPYYWPKVGSLMFVGYYPTGIENKVNYTFTSSENKMTITDYTPGMVTSATSHTEDLMYFNMTPSSYDGSVVGSNGNITTGSNVDVVFRHALSWISVLLVKDANTPDAAKITVNSVKFTNVLPSGDAIVNNSPTGNATNEIVWTADGTAKEIEVCPDDNTETTDIKENEVILVKNNTTILAKQPILIPQTMTGNLVINYTISSTDNSAFTETKTIALNTMQGKVGETTTTLSAWQPARHYTYTITIGTTEILIDPVVTDWTGVSVSLPIQ